MSERIIVVGGSSGLGYACAEKFLKLGHDVLSLSRRGTGPQGALTCKFDIASYGVSRGSGDFDFAKVDFGDTLLISAGMGAFYGPHQITADKFDAMFATNVRGPILMANDFLQFKRRQKRPARIVFVTSTAARRAGHGLGLYSASKAAVESWVRAESPHQAKYGIEIAAASIGWFESPMTESLVPAVRKRAEARCQEGRFATLDEATEFTVNLTTQHDLSGGDYGVFTFWGPVDA